MNEIRNSLLLTALVVAGALVAVVVPMRTASVPAAPPLAGPGARVGTAPGPAEPAPSQHPAAQPPPPPEDRILSPEEERRALFARTLERRYRSQGRAIRIRVEGGEQRRMVIDWVSEPEPRHLESLKTAEPLHRELRGLGFSRLVLSISGQETWHLQFAEDTP